MKYKKNYQVAGISIELQSELEIKDNTFAEKFALFETEAALDDVIKISHRFHIPEFDVSGYEKKVYEKSPWVIYKNQDQWIYILESSPDPEEKDVRQIIFFNEEHTIAEVYNNPFVIKEWEKGGLGSLTLSPTDQIILGYLLSERNGCYIHSDGVKMDGEGYLFVGHSGAGKSTIAGLLYDKSEILCDDRMIVRKWDNGYHIHGNWSHGTFPIVSPSSAPLKGIFFLEQSNENRIIPIDSRMESIKKLLGCVIKPMVTKNWWNKTFDLIDDITLNVPCYRLLFDKSGEIYDRLKEL